MSEYYGISGGYISAVHGIVLKYGLKIQILDWFENVLDEISYGITSAVLTVGSSNGMRRSLVLSLLNADKKYTPSKNSAFWYNRKFRLVSGVFGADGEIYQIPQGVFIASSASESGGVITVNAVDKFGVFGGELKSGKCSREFTTDIRSGDIFVSELVRDVLALNLGFSAPADPITPMIDPYYDTQKLFCDLTLAAGQYYGQIITDLAEIFGADVFYDRFGRLNFRRRKGFNIPSDVLHRGVKWRFEEHDIKVLPGAVIDYQLDGANIVTVATDNSEGPIYSWTARNNNPESPLNIRSIGERRTDEPTVYIAVGDTTLESAEEKCRQYAEYLLLRQTENSISETFTAVLIPHLDTGDIVDCMGRSCAVTGLSLDFAAHTMQVTACNTAWLPNNFTLEY